MAGRNLKVMAKGLKLAPVSPLLALSKASNGAGFSPLALLAYPSCQQEQIIKSDGFYIFYHLS